MTQIREPRRSHRVPVERAGTRHELAISVVVDSINILLRKRVARHVW